MTTCFKCFLSTGRLARSMPCSASRLRCVLGGSERLSHKRFTYGLPSPKANANTTCEEGDLWPLMHPGGEGTGGNDSQYLDGRQGALIPSQQT